jgi:geranylgeranyl pyrophosphate synthase
MERVERLLHKTQTNVEEPLSSKLRGALGGGKRLRPALVILSGEVFTPSSESFYSLAAAVEILHTATLIHDDLVDGASLRRGRETLHTAWPARATILAGDYLLAQAAWLMAELDHPEILKRFAEALRTMSAGEIRQMLVVKDELSREEYYRRIEAKTASLCATATEMAGILAGAEGPQVAALRRFGRELGIAFQIVDDVLDFVGDEARLGKPASSDLRQGLLTLPTLCYLELVKDDTAVSAVLSGQQDAEHMHAAIKAIRSSGAIEAALAEAEVHTRRSQEALAALPDNASRQILHALAEYVVQRRR